MIAIFHWVESDTEEDSHRPVHDLISVVHVKVLEELTPAARLTDVSVITEWSDPRLVGIGMLNFCLVPYIFDLRCRSTCEQCGHLA